MLALLAWSLALALAYCVGRYDGRERERRRIAQGDISRWERDLLRSQGQRVSANPQAAARVHRIRVVR